VHIRADCRHIIVASTGYGDDRPVYILCYTCSPSGVWALYRATDANALSALLEARTRLTVANGLHFWLKSHAKIKMGLNVNVLITSDTFVAGSQILC